METLFTTRDFEERDYERLSEIFHLISPDYHRSADELRFEDEMFDRKKFMLKRYSVVEPDHDVVVATAVYQHNPTMFHPQKFQVGVYVDPAWQRRGIGSSLYNRIMEDLNSLKAITLRLNVRGQAGVSLISGQERIQGENAGVGISPFRAGVRPKPVRSIHQEGRRSRGEDLNSQRGASA